MNCTTQPKRIRNGSTPVVFLTMFALVGAAVWPRTTADATTPPANVQTFVDTYLPLAQEQYQMYGVPVSVALAQSGIETGWGSSQSMLNHNNFFAITSDVNSPRAIGTYVEPSNGYTYTEYASAEDAWLDFGYFLIHDPNYASALPYINQPRVFYEKIYCIYTWGNPTCDASAALQIWDSWTFQYDVWPPLMLPFAEGEVWYVCQGYNGLPSHGGANALDLSVDPASAAPGSAGCLGDANASTGKQVLMPQGGDVVETYGDAVCVNLDSGRSMYIGHVSNPATGRLERGDLIGTVAAPNEANGNYAHIHVQVHNNRGCAALGPTVPFADEYGTRFEGAPNLPSTGTVSEHRGTALARKALSISSVSGRFFANPTNSGAFTAQPGSAVAFVQDFPVINFNPPAGTVSCSNSISVNEWTRPFTAVIPDIGGSCSTVVAEGDDQLGNHHQAGVGDLYNLNAVFMGSLTVSGPTQVTLNFFSDDGWILSMGANLAGQQPSYVSGPRINPPPVGPFSQYPVIGSYNKGSSPARNDLVVNFPAAGMYPFELDYSECCGGQLVLTLNANGQPILVGGTISGGVYRDSVDPDNAIPGAAVEVCNADLSYCQTTHTNTSGQYSVAGLTPGNYRVRAHAPADYALGPGVTGPIAVGNEAHQGQNIVLLAPLPPPTNPVSPARTGGDGTPVVYWHDNLTFTARGCSGGNATYELTVVDDGYTRSGPMTESPPGSGNYVATSPPLSPHHGTAHVAYLINCPEGSSSLIEWDMYIDPSGVVRMPRGLAVSGATVTLLHSDFVIGPFEPVPDGSALMSPANRINPDMSDALGHFGWDVLAGFYKVRAEKGGCVSPDNPLQTFVESPVMQIPPPRTDLVLILDCPLYPQYLPLVTRNH